MKYNKKPIVTALAVVCVVSLLALASCAPKANSGQAVSSSSASAQSDLPIYTADGQLNDERCLSCHGGSYDAMAATTSNLGDWNPHDPIHGGYNACGNCHDENMTTANSYCDNCHEYAPGTDTVGSNLK